MLDRRFLILFGGLLAASLLFLAWGLSTRVWFILELRAIKLAGLITVGTAVGVATILFQTLSGNRILTPAIMGFDALFLLVQTSLVFFIGGLGFLQLPGPVLFGINTTVMMIAAVTLFGALLRKRRRDIQLMILAGVIFGLLFRSLTSFMQRLIDPSEFAIVQGTMFAQFSGINRIELLTSVCLLIPILVWIWRQCSVLDTMALGRGPARGLGVPYDRLQFRLLCAIAALVSISTALVGPITFLGLLVSSLTYSLMRTHRHGLLLPTTAVMAALILVFGQAVFERLLNLQSTLSIVIEFAGGLFFLFLLARGKLR